jgi:preprotein translocase subunit SecA
MMDRIEDETLRFLFFLQVGQLQQVGNPDEGSEELESVTSPEQQQAARSSIEDFTRNIRRKKERELAELQMMGAGGNGAAASAPVVKGEKVGRNDPCPCGSGKKYKKCHGA